MQVFSIVSLLIANWLVLLASGPSLYLKMQKTGVYPGFCTISRDYPHSPAFFENESSESTFLSISLLLIVTEPAFSVAAHTLNDMNQVLSFRGERIFYARRYFCNCL